MKAAILEKIQRDYIRQLFDDNGFHIISFNPNNNEEQLQLINKELQLINEKENSDTFDILEEIRNHNNGV